MEQIKLYEVWLSDGVAIVAAQSPMLAAKMIKDFYKVELANYRVTEVKLDKPKIIYIEEY